MWDWCVLLKETCSSVIRLSRCFMYAFDKEWNKLQCVCTNTCILKSEHSLKNKRGFKQHCSWVLHCSIGSISSNFGIPTYFSNNWRLVNCNGLLRQKIWRTSLSIGMLKHVYRFLHLTSLSWSQTLQTTKRVLSVNMQCCCVFSVWICSAVDPYIHVYHWQ